MPQPPCWLVGECLEARPSAPSDFRTLGSLRIIYTISVLPSTHNCCPSLYALRYVCSNALSKTSVPELLPLSHYQSPIDPRCPSANLVIPGPWTGSVRSFTWSGDVSVPHGTQTTRALSNSCPAAFSSHRAGFRSGRALRRNRKYLSRRLLLCDFGTASGRHAH